MANVTIKAEIKSLLDVCEEEFKKAVFTAAMTGFDMEVKVDGTLKGYSEGYFGVSFKGKDRKEVKAVAYAFGRMPFDKLAEHNRISAHDYMHAEQDRQRLLAAIKEILEEVKNS